MNLLLEKSWEKELKNEFTKRYYKQLFQFVDSEYRSYPNSIFPEQEKIFAAFELCHFGDVKVVILGQDPYPTRGHANGLCFSTQPEVKPLPRSLNNIYKELSADLGLDIVRNGDLGEWAEQGVLLLNTVLTVREGEPDSHAGRGWEFFTNALIDKLNEKRSNIVYMLWGSKAQRVAVRLNKENNLILTAPHPSPLSAHRGYFGCKHFSIANAYLENQGRKPINW